MTDRTADAKVERVALALAKQLKRDCVNPRGECYAHADEQLMPDGMVAEVDGEFDLLGLARAAIAALEASADAPTEAVTPEMLSAGIDAYRENPPEPRSHGELVEAIYTAMRAATPTAPVPDDEIHPFEDGEDHNPDGFVHATPEQARVIAEAVERKLAPVQDDDAELARRIDNLYEEATNNPCTCSRDENGCPYCNAWQRARREAAALIANRLTPTADHSLVEALRSIKGGSALGREMFEQRVRERKGRLTWWAVNVLQDNLDACTGTAAAALAGKQSVEGQE